MTDASLIYLHESYRIGCKALVLKRFLSEFFISINKSTVKKNKKEILIFGNRLNSLKKKKI